MPGNRIRHKLCDEHIHSGYAARNSFSRTSSGVVNAIATPSNVSLERQGVFSEIMQPAAHLCGFACTEFIAAITR
jgi:hypothetical protein